jgi:type IV pilus assembly protein PilM
MSFFGARAAWGIEVGSRTLRAVRLERTKSDVQITAVEEILYAVEGQDPQVRDEALGKAVDRLVEKHPFGRDAVVVSVPGRSVFIKFIKLPPVEKKRIPEIVKYESRQQIPFPIEEVIWDYQPVLEEFPPGEEIEVGIFAVRREALQEILSHFYAAGIRPDAVQAAPLALYNFFEFDQELEGTTVILDVGGEGTDLLVMDEEGYWPRNIGTAGNRITKALQEKFQISWADAEKLKRTAGASKQAQKLLGVMQPVLATLLREVQQSLGFYRSGHAGKKFDRVLLTGNTFQLAPVELFFQKGLRYPAAKLTEFRRLSLAPMVPADILRERMENVAVACGLALQGLGVSRLGVNLVPPEILQAKRVARKKPYLAAACALLLLASSVSYAVGASRKVRVAGLHQEFLQEVAEVKDDQTELDGLKKALPPLEQHIGALGRLGRDRQTGHSRGIWLKVLAAVEAALPVRVKDGNLELQAWLTDISMERVPNPFSGRNPGDPSHLIYVKLHGYVASQGERLDNLGFINREILQALRGVDIFEVPPKGEQAPAVAKEGEKPLTLGLIEGEYKPISRELVSSKRGGGKSSSMDQGVWNAYYFLIGCFVLPEGYPKGSLIQGARP